MPEHIVRLEAHLDRPLYLWFEPWAEGLSFPARSIVELRAQSEVSGELEIVESTERTAIYGWAGSTLRAFVSGVEVVAFHQPVPSGLTRDKVSMLFGQPPVPTKEEESRIVARPWWRFW